MAQSAAIGQFFSTIARPWSNSYNKNNNEQDKIETVNSTLIRNELTHHEQKTNGIAFPLLNRDPLHPDRRKWNGWGFFDTRFKMDDDGVFFLTGNRYPLSGQPLPYLAPFIKKEMGLDIQSFANIKKQQIELLPPSNDQLSPPRPCHPDFLKALQHLNIRFTTDGLIRLEHSHGHTCQELWALRSRSLPRLVDLVVFPTNHNQVQSIVLQARLFVDTLSLIPFGGGTNVSLALQCPLFEPRAFVSVDMHLMNAILWIDRTNLTACVEAGITGQDLSEKLSAMDLIFGHEPDSFEFSTLGGWVATRASGMKKNEYGNIEDLVISLRAVTFDGVWHPSSLAPRVSSGPDLTQILLGSEGTLGIVTEVIVKIRQKPKHQQYGALIFPTFEHGLAFMHHVARERLQPASIRLVDPLQFRLAMALKPSCSYFKSIQEFGQRFYLSKFLKLNLQELCAVTLLFEGPDLNVLQQQDASIWKIAQQFSGLRADPISGKRGYLLTFSIAYIRDLGFELNFLAESFETSVPWSQALKLCHNVKERVNKAALALYAKQPKTSEQVAFKPFISCRVTQTYDAGCCVYFYFGFNHTGIKNPVKMFTKLEHVCRDEMFKCGGSISHHHGVGKHRQIYLKRQIGPIQLKIMEAIKEKLDPENLFGAGNILGVKKSGIQNGKEKMAWKLEENEREIKKADSTMISNSDANLEITQNNINLPNPSLRALL